MIMSSRTGFFFFSLTTLQATDANALKHDGLNITVVVETSQRCACRPHSYSIIMSAMSNRLPNRRRGGMGRISLIGVPERHLGPSRMNMRQARYRAILLSSSGQSEQQAVKSLETPIRHLAFFSM
ncbi:hypothetical protein F4821DRAFT_174825 [Hypoxylon rubiginosum]|uniref:Uncharacterized protein n=1 Tax=Hypoxylon rubiginosum TaxID=110542 RepID=A0ACC0DGR5_9PEZI|nr:hypothetical protein F4821DRAFT_174825 [Hypoxylon rubiginosum]